MCFLHVGIGGKTTGQVWYDRDTHYIYIYMYMCVRIGWLTPCFVYGTADAIMFYAMVCSILAGPLNSHNAPAVVDAVAYIARR